MKKLSFSTMLRLLFVVCLFNLISCQELGIDSQGFFPDKIEIDAQPEYNVVAISPRPVVFNISSNTPWRISSSENWCTPTPAMSATSSLIEEITVNIEDNEAEEPRTATLTISADGIDEETVITIVQGAKSNLLVQPIDDNLPNEGGSATFTITSNMPWSVISANQWLTFDISEGTGTNETEVITATASANPGAIRSTTVTVTNGLETKTFEAVQDGIILEFVELEDPAADLQFSYAGETKSYSVNASIPWKVGSDTEWVTLEIVSETEFTVTVPRNKYFTAQTAVINLLPEDNTITGFEDITMEISQPRSHWENVVAGNTITYNESNGSVTLRSEASACRLVTNEEDLKLGVYKWTFADVNVGDPAMFDVLFYNGNGDPKIELVLGTAYSTMPNVLACYGTNFSSKSYFDLTVAEMNNMKTLTIEFIPNPDDPATLILRVLINDEELVSVVKENVYADEAVGGNRIYYGFTVKNVQPSEVTMSSFEIIPVEE